METRQCPVATVPRLGDRGSRGRLARRVLCRALAWTAATGDARKPPHHPLCFIFLPWSGERRIYNFLIVFLTRRGRGSRRRPERELSDSSVRIDGRGTVTKVKSSRVQKERKVVRKSDRVRTERRMKV